VPRSVASRAAAMDAMDTDTALVLLARSPAPLTLPPRTPQASALPLPAVDYSTRFPGVDVAEFMEVGGLSFQDDLDTTRRGVAGTKRGAPTRDRREVAQRASITLPILRCYNWVCGSVCTVQKR